MLLGELVHARSGREVVGILGAAVEHDHQGHRLLSGVTAGDVQLVGASPGRTGVGPLDELTSRGHNDRPGHALCRSGQAVGQPRQATRKIG